MAIIVECFKCKKQRGAKWKCGYCVAFTIPVGWIIGEDDEIYCSCTSGQKEDPVEDVPL